MPRSARLVVPTVPHHLTHRGNNKQTTFFADGDYRLYRKYLAAACADTKTSIWAWCLMPNHVHLILAPPAEDALAAVMRRTQGRYTRAINAREGRVGHLWQARFASFVMDETYLLACARYVELNPVRAGLVARAEDWPWSSARVHLGQADDGLTNPAPLLERWPDWRQVIETPLEPSALTTIRERERTGRPLGRDSFVRRFVRAVAKPPARRGRPPKSKT